MGKEVIREMEGEERGSQLEGLERCWQPEPHNKSKVLFKKIRLRQQYLHVQYRVIVNCLFLHYEEKHWQCDEIAVR